MKLSIPRPSLVEALQTCAPAAKASQVIPILSHVLLTASTDRLTFRATDTEVTIETSRIATVESAGGATVDLRSLLGLVKAFDADEVSLEWTSNQIATLPGKLTVASGRSRYELPSRPEDQFPVANEEGMTDDPLEIGAEDFRLLLKSSAFAMGDQADGSFCRGVWISAKSKILTLFATNGKRLVSRRVAAGGNLASSFIPSHGVRAIASFAPIGEDVMANLSVGDSHIAFRFLDTSLLVRCIDAPSAPDFAGESKKHAAQQWVKGVNVPLLLAAIRRAMTIRDDGSSRASAIMELAISPGTLNIAARRSDAAGKEEVGADADFSLETEVEARYLAEFLESLDCERIAIGTNGPTLPFIFRQVDEIGDDSPTVEYILMPISKGLNT